MESLRRLFIAVDVPEQIKTEIQAIQRGLRKQKLFTGRYTAPESIHITLQFVGEVERFVATNIQERLQYLSMPVRTAKLGSVDVFSTGQKINIIFVHVIAPQLVKLAREINYNLRDIVKAETRPFIPHLTIARVKSVQDRQKLLHYVNALQLE